MTVTVAAPPRVQARPRVGWRTLYGGTLAFWVVTRLLVLVHQGAWPWMNAFVVDAARGMVVGDWNEAVRPQLPAVLGVPLVLAGATEQQTVAVLYVVASLIQFGAFLALVRALFPARLIEQALALLFFVLVPYNHSIHHYRDVPVVLASSGVFLLGAHWLHAERGDVGGVRSWLWVFGSTVLAVWSRTEALTFVGVLVVLGLVAWRARALKTVGLYIGAAAIASGALLLANRLEGVDPAEAGRYQWHTFLDSTPESWLSPECRADATENCREQEGLTYFGPADPQGGVLPMVEHHPLTTLAKTAQSAWDNVWIILGPNSSTFPGIVPFLFVVGVVVPAAREELRRVPAAAWMLVVATLAETVLPPLSWAPPHPQYHLQMVLAVVVPIVAVLAALWALARGRWVVILFFVGNAALSAFRYTRYPGY
ncbi:MAG: hypothetical protein JOZ81_05275 [Chloroflexi bacterium]|nr:hypothetical protein [Chloroflexota bacterium]